MQVRLVISTLLLALQISAAALSEQPRTARLVKVKRAISLGADGAETERLQTSLKRRTIEAFSRYRHILQHRQHAIYTKLAH